MVSDAVVEEVRARADLVEICSEYMPLKRVGKSYRGPCPLHGGEGRNFAVDPAKGIFKCFVCDEGGDVFSFVMKHLGLDFPSAVRYVAGRVGVEIPETDEPREDPYGHLRAVASFAEEWFAEQLRGDGGVEARRYLEKRGIDMEAAERYGLGYAPDAWRAMREAAGTRGIEERHLLEVGLLATSERAEEPYDRFRHRLMFSIRDLRDRPIGFGGRAMGESGEGVPKYINSPDSPIFHKGKLLYGLNWARHSIRRDGHAAIVEGYTDVLSLHLHGLSVAVAGLGTAFSSEQAESLGRYAQQVYLVYDSDDAGLRATFKAADILLAAGLHPLVVTLPEGEDPDSVVRERGVGALRAYFQDAVDVLERKLQILEREGYLANIEGRRRAIDGLLSTLRSVRDPALRDIYLDRAVERTGVRRETLVHEIARQAEGGGARPSGEARRRAGREPPSEREETRAHPAERNLVLLLVRDRSLVERAVAAGITSEDLRDAGLRAVYSALAADSDGPDGGGEDDWTARVAGVGLRPMEDLLTDDTELTSPLQIFDESVRRLLHRPQLERLREIDRELELADEGQARELLVEKQGIAERLREAGFPLSFLQKRRRGPAGPSSHD